MIWCKGQHETSQYGQYRARPLLNRLFWTRLKENIRPPSLPDRLWVLKIFIILWIWRKDAMHFRQLRILFDCWFWSLTNQRKVFLLIKLFCIPLCDTNSGTRDRSFLLDIRCLSHLLWLNQKIFLIGTNGNQKFENLTYSHNFFRFLIAL